MKILKLESENFMNIKIVKVDLDGKPLIISGDNAQGKSSLRNAIFSMLEGLKVSKPVRDGEDQAKMRLELGDEKGVKFIVEEVKGKGEKFRVTAPPTEDGAVAEYAKPRQFLQQFMSFISVDPGELATLLKSENKADSRKAREMLIDMLDKHYGKSFDEGTKTLKEMLVGYDKSFDTAKENRSNESQKVRWIEDSISRDIPKEIMGMLDQIPDELKTTSEVIKKMDDFGKRFKLWEDYQDNMIDVSDALKDKEYNVTCTQEEIDELEKELMEKRNKLMSEKEEVSKTREILKKLDEEAPKQPDNAEIEGYKKELTQIGNDNVAITKKQEYNKLCADLERAKNNVSVMLKEMNKIEETKQKSLSKIKMPLDGLSISEDGILFKGLPLSVDSESNLIRVATSILIAMNPKLKTIVLRNGNAFTLKNLKEYIQWADAQGYQIITEFCDDSGEVGLYIEDGEVKKIN